LNYFGKSDSDALNKLHIMGRLDLSDEKWALIEPHFPKSRRGPARQEDGQILNGIVYILRMGRLCVIYLSVMGHARQSIIVTIGAVSVAFRRTTLMRAPKIEKLV
jgi:hypothetical protein